MDKHSPIRRIHALIKKEFYQIIRDSSSILISVLLPLILLFIYGYGVSLDANHIRIGLVMQDSSADAIRFEQSLQGSRFFDVQVVRSFEEISEQIIAGKVRGIVVVPSYFTQYLNREDEIAPIQVIADGSEPNTAAFVQNYVFGAWSTWLLQEKINQGLVNHDLVKLQPRYWYNEDLDSRNFLIPGSIAIIMTLIGTLLTALVIAREWERGTMEAMMATPVRVIELVIGKLIPYFLLGMGSMVLCVIVAVVIYEVPLRGSFFALTLSSGAFLFTSIQLGLLISIVSKNQFVASQISIITGFLPAFILSGFIFEISSMPKVIQWITQIIPARYFVSCLQTIFLVGDVWQLILPNTLAILVIGFVLLIICAKKFVKRLE